jgi:hypothetical protein
MPKTKQNPPEKKNEKRKKRRNFQEIPTTKKHLISKTRHPTK